MRDYRTFLKVKSLPSYRVQGHVLEFPDEYAELFGSRAKPREIEYTPIKGLFDYQEAIARMAIQKRKFCVYADCGLGKTMILLEWCRHVAEVMPHKPVLIVSPLMVVKQTIEEAQRWYGGNLCIQQIHAKDLGEFTKSGKGIGITNYEALSDEVTQGNLGAIGADEASTMKSHYGAWGQHLLRLGAGLDYKLALTGTPAPNDRIEFANHAVFMDAFQNVNSFLAKFFVNRGQTDNRWELKPHALRPFYRALSHWCIFLTNPATYGWKDNSEPLPPIHVHIQDVPLTREQQDLAYDKTGDLFANKIGGIGNRSVLSQIAKGSYRGKRIETRKPDFIRELVESWPDESTIIWCWYNEEQKIMEETFPDAVSLDGSTPIEDRLEMIDDFKSGKVKVLITKPKILGFGINLQIATRHVFSGLVDSYEAFYQCIKRSNRYGSRMPLNVHIPVTDIERPMIETVLRKAKRVQQDTEEQEKEFYRAAQ